MNIKPIYPIFNDEYFFDKIIQKLKHFYIFCPICGSFTYIWNINKENYRETCICKKCGSTNRNRQLGIILCNYLSKSHNIKIKSLKDINKIKVIKILNTETNGPIHDMLKNQKGYVCSEYINEKYVSGKKYNGILHEDLNSTSFKNNYFDIIITSDVFEHIPNPYQAFKEIYRILKPNGVHIFTVPFKQNEILDETRTKIIKNIEINIKTPIYHLDPLRPKGILVYTIFSLEMLIKLNKIGLFTSIFNTHHPFNGILGTNATVFLSQKEVKKTKD